MEEHIRFYVRDAGLKKGSISNLICHISIWGYAEAEGRESRFEKSYHKQKPKFTLFFITLVNETFAVL